MCFALPKSYMQIKLAGSKTGMDSAGMYYVTSTYVILFEFTWMWRNKW